MIYRSGPGPSRAGRPRSGRRGRRSRARSSAPASPRSGRRLGPRIAGLRPRAARRVSLGGVDLTARADVAGDVPFRYAARDVADAADPADARDGDGDGFTDRFERRLAAAFQPVYHVSGGESDHFANFKDQPRLEVVPPPLPANPPAVYYRVSSQGFDTPHGGGAPYGFVQVHYLTEWDHDSGLEVSADCQAVVSLLQPYLGPLVGLLDGLGSHAFDEEYSAVLLGAPALDGGSNPRYETDPLGYKAYAFYLPAHEGLLPFDHSVYLVPQAPLSPGHLHLWLSRRKHGTYPANPDGLPIFREEVIALAFAAVEAVCAEVGPDTCAALQGLLYALFFGCVVEHFDEQGGAFAASLTNVGELSRPVHGCGWINAPSVREKLTETLWEVSR